MWIKNFVHHITRKHFLDIPIADIKLTGWHLTVDVMTHDILCISFITGRQEKKELALNGATLSR